MSVNLTKVKERFSRISSKRTVIFFFSVLFKFSRHNSRVKTNDHAPFLVYSLFNQC